jgi:Na+/H+-translocating membrane pyrophosphatase
VANFCRVGGCIADVDKVEAGLIEDSAGNSATITDNVGGVES